MTEQAWICIDCGTGIEDHDIIQGDDNALFRRCRDDYRRYTTAELAAMPDTAEFEDRQEYQWRTYSWQGKRRAGWLTGAGYYTTYIPNSRLARRKLRMIA